MKICSGVTIDERVKRPPLRTHYVNLLYLPGKVGMVGVYVMGGRCEPTSGSSFLKLFPMRNEDETLRRKSSGRVEGRRGEDRRM